jgi:calmodulin
MVLSTEQIAEIQEYFDIFDEEKTGRILVSQLDVTLRYLGFFKSSSEHAEFVKKYVTDDPEYILFSEFLKIMEEILDSTDPKTAIQEAFDLFIKNEDGTVPAKTVRHIMTNLGERLSDTEVDDMFFVAGIDEESNLTFDDFYRMTKIN